MGEKLKILICDRCEAEVLETEIVIEGDYMLCLSCAEICNWI